MIGPVLTDRDRADFDQAISLIQGVIDRHLLEYSAVIGVHVQAAVHGIELVRKDFGEVPS